MKMKQLASFALAAVFAMSGIASATLLTNGDFSQDDGVSSMNALGWDEYNSQSGGGGWVNRETNANGPYGDTNNFHYAMGMWAGYGATVSQDVAIPDDGMGYELTADNSLDAWWMNSAYLRLEFYGGGTLLNVNESAHWSQPNYDVGTAWANYSLKGTAPAGSDTVRVILGSYGEGGTARFDNAVLVAIPEPATIGLLGLAGGGLVLFRRRFKI
jgi:hypothetical protein